MARKQLPAFDDYCDDSVIPGEQVLSDQEKAYRRGYHQGAWMAMDTIREGVPLHEVEDWVTRKLKAWRLKGHLWLRGTKVKAEQPPAPPDEISTVRKKPAPGQP